MTNVNVNKIFIEGIDKSGKDTIAKYVAFMGKYKYMVLSRGLMSQIAYSHLYNREFDYNLSMEQNSIYVYLVVSKKDWQIRCKLTNEPEIDFNKNVEAFEYAIEKMNRYTHILICDTTEETPYNIAKRILKYAEQLNNKEKDI